MRVRNFDEVSLGFTPEQAVREAKRCLGCKKPLCIHGCPVEVDIPEFIELIRAWDFDAAADAIRRKNALPAICGRVCPQETQCERACTLGKRDEPVAIGKLERFAASYGNHTVREASRRGRQVAVVGSGPAGLTAAGELARGDYQVTLFEALHKPGGVLTYGIPEFRLPQRIVDVEVEYVRQLGVDIQLNVLVGKTVTISELLSSGFEAIFIAAGAGLPQALNVPGESLNGVYYANEYLARVNLMRAFMFPTYDTPIKRGRSVVVIGGGNVAMDAARTALRLGAETVQVVYRRGRNEMPARHEEIRHAEEEGITFQLRASPVAFVGSSGRLEGVQCVRMRLCEPDESGRCRPEVVPGSDFVIDCDVAVVAVGNSPNPLLAKSTPTLATTTNGALIAHDETGATSMAGVFAGGDIATGAATVISAMGAGKRAARAIHEYLNDS
ncbi:MAG: NADPH-dependent glutamate synthase [Halobacteriota archaeon]